MSRGEFNVAGWKVEPQLHCLFKGETSVHVEPKVMRVLVELASHPGEVLAKDDLIKVVWPNTFVGDDALIRCISELRRVFDDDPRSPRVIQTISKVGYRLIAPVSFATTESAASAPAPIPVAVPGPDIGGAPALPSAPEPAEQPVVPPKSASVRSWGLPAIAGVAVLLLAFGWLLYGRLASHATPPEFRTVPFTSYEGSERQPAFSPDGEKIAFSWTGEAGDDRTWNIYVKMIDSETPIRLTKSPDADLSPAWSPDQKWIAFIRNSSAGSAVYVVPAIGGPERKIYDMHCFIDFDDPGLAWSPDGKRLLFPDFKSQSSPSAIVSLDVNTLQAQKISSTPEAWDGDFGPRFSPDGSKVAFVRGKEGANRNIFIMDPDGSNVRQLTTGGGQVQGLAWTADGKAVVYSSSNGGSMGLWRVGVSGGPPERLPVGSANAITPTIAMRGNRLAYSEGSSRWFLMRVDLKSPQAPIAKLTSSTEQDSAPNFSPDGKQIAFQSWRSGAQEIWVSAADGTGPVRMTYFDGPLTGSPAWSPEGKRLAFDSRPKGWSHIFIMNAAGGTPRQVTDGDDNDIIPTWSRDGKSIYFGSRRNGAWQIWKVNLENGQVKQITRSGGYTGDESPDGSWFYYVKYDAPGLWRVPADGGEEAKILDDPPSQYRTFSLSKDGIYFINSGALLGFKSYGGKTVEVRRLARMPSRFVGMTVSPDGHWLLYSDHASSGNNIMLVENFR